MEANHPQELLGLLGVTVAALVAVAYVFLRMMGVLGPRHGRHHRGSR